MLLVFLRAIRANNSSIRDSLILWHINIGDEVNSVGSIDVADALRGAAEFVREAFHPDGSVLVKFDEVAELEGLSCLVVEDCSSKVFVGEVLLQCCVELPQLESMVCRCETVGVFAFRAFDVDAWNKRRVDGGVDEVGTRTQVVAGLEKFVIIFVLKYDSWTLIILAVRCAGGGKDRENITIVDRCGNGDRFWRRLWIGSLI